MSAGNSRRTVLIAGGRGPKAARGDVWSLAADQRAWTERASSADLAREDHGLFAHEGRVFAA